MANVNLSKVYSDLFDFIYAWGDGQYRGTIDGKYYPVSISGNESTGYSVSLLITDSQGFEMNIPEERLTRDMVPDLYKLDGTSGATSAATSYLSSHTLGGTSSSTGSYSGSSTGTSSSTGSYSSSSTGTSSSTGSYYSSSTGTSSGTGSYSSSYYSDTTTSGSTGVTGSLSMADATYATSKAGIKELSSILQSEIDRAINYLSSSEYTTMINTISRYWVGVDADKFKKQIQNELTADASLFKSYKSIVQNALNAQLTYHEETQSKIADAIQIQS